MKARIFEETLPLVEYAVASSPLAGESECGDLHVMKIVPRGLLMAVLDGVGHGSEAAAAAHIASAVLTFHAGEGVISLIQHCHQRLKGTRGVVASLVALDGVENTVTSISIGNVEAIHMRSSPEVPQGCDRLVMLAGLLGYRLPALRASVSPITPGDLLIFATDGIRAGFPHAFGIEDRPVRIAEYICSNFRKDDDDGLVLVARYRGSACDHR